MFSIGKSTETESRIVVDEGWRGSRGEMESDS